MHYTYYKILGRIVASHLRPILAELLHPSQHGGVQGGGIFDAVATVRDYLAYAEKTQTPLCVLSLDFTEAFSRISHTYLFKLLSVYGFSTKFTAFLKNIYDQAYSSLHINGHTTSLSYTMWGTTRLSVEYVVIRLVSKHLAMAFRSNTHGNQN